MPDNPVPPTGEIILYQTDDGKTRVECRFAEETLWLSQALIAELFQKDVRTINEHLQNIYEEGELDPGGTIRKFRIVRREGTREVVREIEHYNLDAILAVGYRVRSERGTQFRRWATERLREYLIKGFTMDDQQLKNPPVEGSGALDYFDELLERIRDIRASERRMYLRVREIFALAGDYDPSKKETAEFFQTIQNRLHFAATGETAPELIAGRADHTKPNMGLTAWKDGVVREALLRYIVYEGSMMNFVQGQTYTRNEIYEALGGSKQETKSAFGIGCPSSFGDGLTLSFVFQRCQAFKDSVGVSDS